MRFCISSRQPTVILDKADELFVRKNDEMQIYDLLARYPDKLILTPYNEDRLPALRNIINLYPDNIILTYDHYNEINLNYPFICQSQVQSVVQLESIASQPNCRGLYLGVELSHKLHDIRAKFPSISVRAVANVSGLPVNNHSYAGSWIRPEDIDYYDTNNYINVLEFDTQIYNPKDAAQELKLERTLFKVYAEDKSWPTLINTIIKDLPFPSSNRLISPDLVARRSNCSLMCFWDGRCRRCLYELNFTKRKLKEGESQDNAL